MSEVTGILSATEQGDLRAAEQLLSLVYSRYALSDKTPLITESKYADIKQCSPCDKDPVAWCTAGSFTF
jgi:hypothetical protein